MNMIEQPTLSELAVKYGTDKGTSVHGYTEHYPLYFDRIKNENLTVLEIGVAEGSSLRMWEEYFPNAQIIGLDVNFDCRVHAGGRKTVYIGSQTDVRMLKQIAKDFGPLDILIDDGSHQWAHQVKTFKLAWELVKPGGYYIVEDLGTSYSVLWGRRPRPGTSILDVLAVRPPSNYFKSLLDELHMGWSDIEFMHFYRELCVIKKKS